MGPRRRWQACMMLLLAVSGRTYGSSLQTDTAAPVFPTAASAVLPDPAPAAPADGQQNGSVSCPAGAATTKLAVCTAVPPAAVVAAAPAAAAQAAALQQKPRQQLLEELRDENDWKNSLILWVFPDPWMDAAPRVVRSWLRCYLMCMILYMVTGAAWAYYIYFAFRRQLFGAAHTPATADMAEQIKVSCLSIPIYSMLPAIQEWVIEAGWTKAYSRVSDVGVAAHIAYFVAFMTSVEFGVYWMHRLLHDVKVGYKKLHYIHHKYNKEHSLSPFAGLAFHPLDGILQAIPYCWTLFFIPAHFLTFEMLLFLTGVWTTNIHDCLDGKVEPIMGAGYHTIHHTTYKHNYGHYFVYMDKIFGSLVTPDEYAVATAKPGNTIKAA